MMNLQSGVLDRTKMVTNILMIVLVAGNLYFSIQYIQSIKDQSAVKVDNTAEHLKLARFLSEFTNIVLNSQGTVTYEDRVKLESDILQTHNELLIKQWQAFVTSKTPPEAQANAVKLISLIADNMIS